MKRREIMKNVKELLKDYEACKDDCEKQISSKLKIKYDCKDRNSINRHLIINALVFWKFVINYLSAVNWYARHDFLSHFLKNSNSYIGLIAMIEFFPTSVR
ncbi:hypothetical protein AUJ27_01820 [Candidatus Falkowbacteria bacterium CG1_02_37_44]|uniref:Uncharacterized protein n=2 Tax=Candidatus Falkowiibacteriota TaxID=1752728 RepID=A0A1J4T8V7_9BACT|nr:MAG: hypothetical protein AUJ27_01820 [Candidatus Falkowbacteria bacterium CG1_02_37_44]PIV52176.1 MAG: hypothetical protein COS18_00035 [Candidatus Falkowbacteria bacterium CG02_land_8_20_14_3_00_36_14]